MTEQASTVIDVPKERKGRELVGTAAGTGRLDPDRFNMLAAIAEKVVGTRFVPGPMRNDPAEIFAALLYGDSLGLHPSVALKEIDMIEGKPSLSASAVAALIRQAGHSLKSLEIRDSAGAFVGVTVAGKRADTGDEGSATFTLEDAQRAGLLSKNNWKHYPHAMCHARAVTMIGRELFSDIFLGAIYTGEELGAEATDQEGRPVEAPPALGSTGRLKPNPDPEMVPEPPPKVPEANAVASVVPPIDQELNAEESILAVRELGLADTILARGIEENGKNRTTVLRALDARLTELRAASEPPPDAPPEPPPAETPPAKSITEVMAEAANAAGHGEVESAGEDQPSFLAPAGAEPQPEPESFAFTNERERQLARVKGAIAYIYAHPDEVSDADFWKAERVIGSASNIWQKPLHSINDFEDWMLAKVQEALPEQIRAYLSNLSDAELNDLAGE